MKPGTAKETAIVCAAAMVAIGVLTIPFDLRAKAGGTSSKAFVLLVLLGVVALGLVLGFHYLTAGKRVQLELAGTEQYRQLADEYRRLTDVAITAQEHTDLKLGDLSAQLDYLREQCESMQKILKEVE
jgi:uncharacterized protein HemX